MRNGKSFDVVYYDDLLDENSELIRNIALEICRTSAYDFDSAVVIVLQQINSVDAPILDVTKTLTDLTRHFPVMETKGQVTRRGDFVWIGGVKKLWRKLSDSDRRFAERDLKEQEESKPWEI